MPKLEELVNKNLNKIYKKIKYLTYCSLIPLTIAMFDGCKKDSPTQPISPPKNKPPVVKIIEPANNNFTIKSNDVITFRWQGSDEDGKVVKYNYGLGEINEDNSTQKTYSNLSVQNYRFHVRAQDDKSEWGNTDEKLFTVQTYVPPAGPTGNTNSSGYVKIQLGTSTFGVYVKNLSNQPLSNIKVSGGDYGIIQGFLAEDFSLNYLSEVYYTGGYGLGKSAATMETPEIFLRAKANNEARSRKLPNLRNNKDIEYLGVSSFSDIKSFYQEYDLITNLLGISYLEYLLDNAGKKFAYPIKAAKFREDIIENASNYGKIVNQITSSIGKEWDADALYLDVWRPKVISVLSHYFSEDKLCTLKGKVIDINDQPISGARVSVGVLYGDTDSNGNYVIKSYKHVKRNIEGFLREGTYTVTASATNYVIQTKNINLVAATPQDERNPYIASNKLDFQLGGPIGGNEQTIVFQPKSEGIDSYVAYNSPNTNYGNDPSLYTWYQPNVTLIRSYIKIDFSTMPRFSQITSASLSLSGASWHVQDSSLSQAEVAVKRIISSWNENTITWNLQPSLGETITTKKIGSFGWQDIDITSTVNNWLRGSQPNYGILIMLYNETVRQEATFHSSDVSGSTQPKLTIKYKL